MAKTYKSKKAKGRAFEIECAAKMVEFGIDRNAKRMPLSGADSYLKGDIYFKHDENMDFKFVIEVKNQESVNIYDWWKQAVEQAGINEPLLFFRRNHTEPLAICRRDTFLSLWSALIEARSSNSTQTTDPKDYRQIEAYNALKFHIKKVKELLTKLDL